MAQRDCTIPSPRRAIPTATPDRIRVFLWLRREDTKPELNCANANPEEMRRKREPACAWVIPSSSTRKGMSGARMNRARKLRRNRPAMKKTAPALALKGSGMGHAFSIIILNHRTSTWPGVLNLEGKNSQFYCDQIIDQVHTQMLEKPARTVKNIPCGPVQIKVRFNTHRTVLPSVYCGRKSDVRLDSPEFEASLHFEVG
jgi:hypothetical protein